MSKEERTLVDTSGDYCYAVRGGDPVADPEWRSCRLVVSSERLVLATSDGMQAVGHTAVELLDDAAVEAAVDATGTTPFRIGDHVVLIDALDVDSLAWEYCRATLHGEIILANSPAVVGGVVQDDAEWGKARFTLLPDAVELEFPDGDGVAFDVGDVGTVDTDSQTVVGERTAVRLTPQGRRVAAETTGER